jgi:hypothetical protein
MATRSVSAPIPAMAIIAAMTPTGNGSPSPMTNHDVK